MGFKTRCKMTEEKNKKKLGAGWTRREVVSKTKKKKSKAKKAKARRRFNMKRKSFDKGFTHYCPTCGKVTAFVTLHETDYERYVACDVCGFARTFRERVAPNDSRR